MKDIKYNLSLNNSKLPTIVATSTECRLPLLTKGQSCLEFLTPCTSITKLVQGLATSVSIFNDKYNFLNKCQFSNDKIISSLQNKCQFSNDKIII